MDTVESNQFKSLDDFFKLVSEFASFSEKVRDPNVAQLEDYFKVLKQRDPNLFVQSNSLDDVFKGVKQSNPNSLALELAKRLVTSSQYTVHYCEICVGLLRELLAVDPDLCTWLDLPVSTQSTIKTTLIDRIMKEESSYISVTLSFVVMKLAPSLISANNNSWPELLPCFYQCLTSSTSPDCAKFSVFRIFADLADKIGETIFSSLNYSFHSLLRNTLNDDTLNTDVRVAALFASVNFILCVSSSNEKEQFQDLLAAMMKTLTDAVSSTEEVRPFSPKEITLTYLTKLAKHEPRFFRMQLVNVVFTILDIVEIECLDEEVMHSGVEFLITLVEAKEKAPGMMKKLPSFICRCLAMLLKLVVLGIKDDPTWYSAETMNDPAGTTNTFCDGCHGLMRFSMALGRKSVAHEAIEQVSDYLDAPEWEKRCAALFSLSNIVEGCSEVITKNLKPVISMVLNCFQDDHPRVRWAACFAITFCFQYFEPHVREEYFNQVYIALSVVLDDFHPRLQACATRALGEILSDKLEAMVPHLDGIVNKLFHLLQSEKQMVQQEALTSLAALAESVKEDLETYYDIVMPHLKGVLRNTDISFRTSAIKCIGAIGKAVGKERFREDGNQVMEVLMPLQGFQESEDNSSTWEMLTACVGIWECMGIELEPYISEAIPFLIQCAEWQDENHGIDDKIREKVMFRDKKIWKMQDYLAEKLAHVCEVLCCCAEILKEDFFPWIPKVVSVLVPLLKFHNNNHVRKYAVKAMRVMFDHAKLAVEKGNCGSEPYFMELSGNIIKAFVEALHKEQVGDLCLFLLDQLKHCIQICGPLLHDGLVRSIMDEIKHIISDSESRKEERRKREKFEDFDDEEADLLKDERGVEGDIFSCVCQILLTFIKAFKAVFLPFFDELSPDLLPMLAKEKTISSDRSGTICICVTLVMVCPEVAGKYYEVYFPLILGLSDDEDPNVREGALFGLWLWAIYDHSSFKPFVGEALSKINKVITHSKAREPENEHAYDNAVSALGMICEFHGESIDLAEVIPVWLNCLPIKVNLMAAKHVHDQLCSMVES